MNFFKSFSIYTLVSFFGAGINFLLMPLLSYYLSPTDYGITSLINTYVSFISPFLGFIAFGIITVEYYRIKDRTDFASLFSSIQIIPVLPTIFISLVTLPFYKKLAVLLELPPDQLWIGGIIFILSLLIIYIETSNSYLIIAKKIRLYTFFTIGRVITETLLTVYFVIFLRKGWEGRIISWAITTVLFSIASFYIFYREGLLTLQIKKKYIYSSLAYGIPLVPHTIGKYIINQSDRVFIAKMVSLSEAGIYSVGYTVGMVMMLLITALSNVFTPFLMERLSNISEEKKLQVVRLSYQLVLGMFIALLLVNLISPLLFSLLISKKYSAGASYVFWVSLGYFFWGCYLLFSGYIFFFKKTMILFWLAIINIFSNLLFNYFFIKEFGALGAAYATALSFFIVFIIVLIQSNRLIKLPWFLGLKTFRRLYKNAAK
jgi:O-antigen/teichoic acid export membrane protein